MTLLTEASESRAALNDPTGSGGPRSFTVRPYGEQIQDLDIPFSNRPQPLVITDLLSTCLQSSEGRALGERELLDWTVAERRRALLLIYSSTKGSPAVVTTRCMHKQCAQPIEFELDLSGPAQDSVEDRFEWPAPDGRRLLIRLPTGRDQWDWLTDQKDEDGPWAVRMATRLIVRIDGRQPLSGWQVPEEWVEGIGACLESRDRLTALRLEQACPCCHRMLRIEVDLTDVLLRGLAETQGERLNEIHALASAYRWTEAQILAIPSWRRAQYLTRLKSEARG